MKAYKHLDINGQDPAFTLGDKAFYEMELSAEEEAILKKDALYDEYYKEPGSHKAHEDLHTHYVKRENY